MIKQLFLFLHRILPKHAVSRLAGALANCTWPWLTQWAIKIFIKIYNVNMQEVLQPEITQYKNFNAFFIRQLLLEARPIASSPQVIVSPADGVISQYGQLDKETILQAKGHHYTLTTLLAGRDSYSRQFINGHFLTTYLAPKDYHRFHMPIDGKLLAMRYVPGRLYSVSPLLVNNLDNVFADNERVICFFETALGLCAYIAVGATIVGSIATTWQGVVTPRKPRRLSTWNYQNRDINLKKGDEVGYFAWGSTVILLFPKNTLEWHSALQSGGKLHMGEEIAKIIQPT